MSGELFFRRNLFSTTHLLPEAAAATEQFEIFVFLCIGFIIHPIEAIDTSDQLDCHSTTHELFKSSPSGLYSNDVSNETSSPCCSICSSAAAHDDVTASFVYNCIPPIICRQPISGGSLFLLVVTPAKCLRRRIIFSTQQ